MSGSFLTIRAARCVRTQAWWSPPYVAPYVAPWVAPWTPPYVAPWVAPWSPPEDDDDDWTPWTPPYVDNYVDDGYNEAAFYVAPYVAPYVDNYVDDGYQEAAGYVPYVAPYVPPEPGSWDWMHEEAMNAMYAGSCSTCYTVGTINPKTGEKVTVSDLKTEFYNQPEPFGPPAVDDKVEIFQQASCGRRSRARRSRLRRQLRQKMSACLQTNVKTLFETIENVRWRAPARRSTIHFTDSSPRRERGGAAREPDAPPDGRNARQAI